MIDVAIVYEAGCPNVELARERVRTALAGAGLPARWRELERAASSTPAAWRGFASPTVLVGGEDVVPGHADHSACRLYDVQGRLEGAPPAKAILDALERQRTAGRGGAALGAGAASAALLVAFTWACCLPLFAALGVGAFAMGAAIEPWRTPLSIAAVVLLALGVWRDVRARRCGCARRSTSIMLALAAVAIALAFALPWLAAWWARLDP